MPQTIFHFIKLNEMWRLVWRWFRKQSLPFLSLAISLVLGALRIYNYNSSRSPEARFFSTFFDSCSSSSLFFCVGFNKLCLSASPHSLHKGKGMVFMLSLFSGPFSASFSLFIVVISIQLNVTNVQCKFCQWLDLNCRPLVSEVTALPTEPEPLA